MTEISLGGRTAVDLDVLAPVYAAAFAAPPYSEPDAADLLRRLPQHQDRQGFVLAAAREGERVVGFGYGFTGARGEIWTERVAAALGPERAGRLLGGHFELVELAVLPETQGRGIGAALLDGVLATRPEPRVLLQTHDGDTPAMRLYLRAGFERLVEVGFEVVLVKALR
jgi:ribosomal protein S18 acetylase RimI-like enzyme